MFSLKSSKVSDAQLSKMLKKTQDDKGLNLINSLLSRKDILNLDNEKVDVLRLLALHMENKKEMSLPRLINFLKG